MRIERGEMAVLVGPNGAGKETLCRCLGLLLRPESGSIQIDDTPLRGDPWDAARSGLVVVLRGRRVFPELTVRENLVASPAAWVRGWGTVSLDPVFDLFPQLANRRSQIAGTLSGGEQQMVAIGRALLAKPKVLVLDSPTLGLAPRLAAEVYRAIPAICAMSVAVLVIDEHLAWVNGIMCRAYLMVKGEIVREGLPTDVTTSLDSYLRPCGTTDIQPVSP
jgi:branched-chain amino acid transport system ATP-binding protein